MGQRVKLEDLLKNAVFTDASDVEVIRDFFIINDMEEEALDLINALTKHKIEKLKSKGRMVSDWLSFLPSKYLYENYDLDTADKLHRLELDYLANGGTLSKSLLNWARENVPNIERPNTYFNPLVDYLEKNGITFDEKSLDK